MRKTGIMNHKVNQQKDRERQMDQLTLTTARDSILINEMVQRVFY